MKTRGAVVREAPGKWEILDIDMEDPRQGELRLKMVASGLCHSDDHIATGDFPVGMYPFCGGHEGAGVVSAVGPHTPGWQEGDHVVFSFLPSCGQCTWCSRGMQNLCDLGATRLGVCDASNCTHVFVDTSPNQSRRYCSDRCSSRANVAAYRARQRAAAS